MADRVCPRPAHRSAPRAGTAAALVEQLPAGFELSAGAIDFRSAPFSEVTYAYSSRPAARGSRSTGCPSRCATSSVVALLASWRRGTGELVDAAAVGEGGCDAGGNDPKREVDSFASLSVEEWIQAAKRQFLRPPRPFADADVRADPPSNHRSPSRRARARLWPGRVVAGGYVGTAARSADPGARARAAGQLQAALRRDSAALAAGGDQVVLRTGRWSRACWRGRRCPATAPTSVATSRSSCSELGSITRAWSRTSPSCAAWPFSSSRICVGVGVDGATGRCRAVSVGLSQTAIQGFYLFMADHRHEATKALGDPRWTELSDAHARLWRAGEFVLDGIAAAARPTTSIPRHSLGSSATWTSSRWPAIRPRPWSSTGSRARSRARRPAGDARVLLEVLTGRRIRDPADRPRAALPAARHRPQPSTTRTRSSPGCATARQRSAARPTRSWSSARSSTSSKSSSVAHGHLAAMNPASPPEPRYLFVAWQANRLGARPYSAHTLRGRLRGLAESFRSAISRGGWSTFSAPTGCATPGRPSCSTAACRSTSCSVSGTCHPR